MNLIKNRLKRDFSQIPNGIITDLRLSSNALRMYLYLISKPDNWIVNNSDIKKSLNIRSDHTIAKYWKELFVTGWIYRVQIRDSFTGKFIGYEYHLNEYSINTKNKNLDHSPTPKKLIKKTELSKNINSDITELSKNPNSVKTELSKIDSLNNTIYSNNTINNNNTLFLSLSRDKDSRERKISFSKFRKEFIKKYSNFYICSYKDKDLTLNDAGLLELDGKIVSSSKSYEIWSYLYSIMNELEPITKQKRKKVLEYSKKEKLLKWLKNLKKEYIFKKFTHYAKNAFGSYNAIKYEILDFLPSSDSKSDFTLVV